MKYKAYKYRIYPNREQQELINKHIGCCRYVYRDLKLSQRVWTCPNCGRTNQRDLLAANNIKAFAFNKRHNTAGTAEINACGDMNPVRDSAQEAHKSLVCG